MLDGIVADMLGTLTENGFTFQRPPDMHQSPNEEFENGLCIIEPSKPFVRKWFKRIDTSSTVERLASAIESRLLGSGQVSQLRWWPENEVVTQRGA